MLKKFIDKQPLKYSAAMELKIVKNGKPMPFNKIAEHQLSGLYDAKHSGCYHKLSDMSREKKPFDCFFIKEVAAYIVIWWYKPRQKKEMIWIDIDRMILEIKNSNRKSLTEERAKEIGTVIYF